MVNGGANADGNGEGGRESFEGGPVKAGDFVGEETKLGAVILDANTNEGVGFVGEGGADGVADTGGVDAFGGRFWREQGMTRGRSVAVENRVFLDNGEGITREGAETLGEIGEEVRVKIAVEGRFGAAIVVINAKLRAV